MSQYYSKPYRNLGGNINVKVDLSNYATKPDIKNISHVDTSSFALKTNLASLKTDVNKLVIDKLAPVPADLSKLRDFLKNYVAKKAVYDKLVEKVNNIDTSGFVSKTKYDELEKKIPDISSFVKKTSYNSKVDIPATKTELPAVEKKINSVNNLITKTDFNTKVSEIEGKIPNISNKN